MAMDYLPIQASSVPCERIFSSSAETDTKRRNRISPLLMEALQMLKLHLKKERLNFTHNWMTKEEQMVDDIPDIQTITDLLNDGNFQNGLDSIVHLISNHDDQ
jgi:hAT family C-terminal dimerisation region